MQYPFSRYCNNNCTGLEQRYLPKWNKDITEILEQIDAVINRTTSPVGLSVSTPRDVETTETEHTPLEIIQSTGSVILGYRAQISTLSKRLDFALDSVTNWTTDYQMSLRLKRRKGELSQEKQLDILRSLKKELVEINLWLDVEVLGYCSQCNPNYAWSEWNDLMEHKATIGKLLNQQGLNSSLILEQLDKFNVRPNHHTFLAEIVGLQEEIAEKIFAGMTDHETEEDLIHRYFEDVNNFLKTTHNDLPIESVLKHFGFTECRANYIERQIEALPLQIRHHFSILDFANLFVEDLFKYNLLLTDDQPTLPDVSKGYNNVYPFQSIFNDKTLKFSCCNFRSNNRLMENVERFFTLSSDEVLLQEEEGFEYWYHGTDSSAASNIVEIGIDLHKGAARKDFSDGNGFYLSDGFQHALRWLQKRFNVNPVSAILRYKIPQEFWTSNNDGLRLSTDSEEGLSRWQSIVRYNRSRKKDSKQIKPLVKTAPYILGPLSDDGSWEENKDNPNWPTVLRDSWNQLCICNDIVADEFTCFLEKIAFIQKRES